MVATGVKPNCRICFACAAAGRIIEARFGPGAFPRPSLRFPYRPSAMPPAQLVLAPSMICAVVVTYDPDDSSVDCIRSIVAECAHTLIVDNCSDEERRVGLRRLQTAKVTLLENTANSGVAAGFNLGIRAAAALNYRWFLLFDQDTRVFPHTLSELIPAHAQCSAELGPRLGFFGCGYYSALVDGTTIRHKQRQEEGKAWTATDLLITSGTLINLDNFKRIGDFREEFFIDHVDHDYSLRAQRMGFTIARSNARLMVHRLGALRYRRPWQALGAKKMLNYYAPLRRYYQLRNFLALARSYEAEFPSSIASLRRSLHREIGRSLRYETGPCRILISLFMALRDNRRRVSGKYKGGILL